MRLALRPLRGSCLVLGLPLALGGVERTGQKALAGERVLARLKQLARLIGREPVMEA
jgi:hypothetical protein